MPKMPTRNYVGSSGAKYHKMTKSSDDGFVDLQFQRPPPKVPYKAILLATVLFSLGSLLIILGALLLSGVIDAKYADRTWPVLILGLLMFIPGVYHVRIAYYAFKGYSGYSFEDIPEFD
ncbi:transmembrane protein 230-like isoform X2 [Lineus longissimus]